MTVSITIDGRKLRVEEGMNLLEAALQNGIYIPHLCHHPDLPDLGSCRLCLVEVEGQEGVHPSCKLQAADGMVIRTRSEQITRLRNLSMELLLAAHPEDCSTCPKYGKCELQTLIQYMGVSATRMTSRIKGLKMDERNPLLIHDMNRCVLWRPMSERFTTNCSRMPTAASAAPAPRSVPRGPSATRSTGTPSKNGIP